MSHATYRCQRPTPDKRCFRSKAVEEHIARVKSKIPHAELAWMFENCFPSTLDTTVSVTERGGLWHTFVITGDIDAMWLRDSTAQVWPYLPLAREDGDLQRMLEGLVRNQVRCVLLDPYANAFNNGPVGSKWEGDHTRMHPEVHERKWEIDSLCYVIRLSFYLWQLTGATDCFDVHWVGAMRVILGTFKEQQRRSAPGPYSFMRETPIASDTVPLRGWGNPTRSVGLIHSMFRPSDDACIYPFLIPANLFAVTSLRQLATMMRFLFQNEEVARDAESLANEVDAALLQYGTGEKPGYGKIWAYEVDGFGNQLFMDDANVPSLLSLPYLGCCETSDPIYLATRRFVLSHDNPYFYRGVLAEGIGGPHIGPPYIWPMSIVMRGLTSQSESEVQECLDSLIATHADTGFMHESFHRDHPDDYTRAWFAWSNTLFGELVSITFDRDQLRG